MNSDLKNKFICTYKCVLHRPFPFSSYLPFPQGQTPVTCNSVQCHEPNDSILKRPSEELPHNLNKCDHTKMGRLRNPLWTYRMPPVTYLEAQRVHVDCVMLNFSWHFYLPRLIYSERRGDCSLRKILFPSKSPRFGMDRLLIAKPFPAQKVYFGS